MVTNCLQWQDLGSRPIQAIHLEGNSWYLLFQGAEFVHLKKPEVLHVFSVSSPIKFFLSAEIRLSNAVFHKSFNSYLFYANQTIITSSNHPAIRPI